MTLDLSIIIPAYNEENRIEETLLDYINYFSKTKLNFEIFIVLNGCKDNTLGVVKKVVKKHKQINYVDIKEAIGKGGALIEGFKRVNGNLIGFVDADNATRPKEFYDLIKNIEDYDGVIGSRWMESSQIEMPKLRKFLSNGFHFGVNLLFNLKYHDTQCGNKLFKKNAIKSVVNNLGATKWAFDVDLLYLMKRKKYNIKEIPTVWSEPGESHIKLKEIIPCFVLPMIRLRLLYSPFKFSIKLYDLTIGKLSK
ncbi:MAG: glycosyltransferase [Nanoarchaeota archaeon]|nr:glycosyltransferase [Nanoarchaeota archaeon]